MSLFLLEDDFLDNKPAGSVNGTAANPGPGTRTVSDTGSNISLSGGKLVFANGTGTWGQTYLAESALVGRTPGTVGLFDLTPTAANKFFCIGFGVLAQGYPSYGAIQFNSSGVLAIYANNVLLVSNVSSYVGATDYRIAIAQRSLGNYYFIKGGIYTNWTLLYAGTDLGGNNLVPYISSYNAAGNSNFIRIPTTLWLPTPLASDGFGSAFGTTDGLGHAEGVAGGIGSGGGSVSWTQQLGTWADASGAAHATALDGTLNVAVATVAAGTTDAYVQAALTRSAGTLGVVCNYVDANNYIRAIHDGTNCKLIKRVAGVETTVVTAAATYSAGATIVVRSIGTSYYLFYNNAYVGSGTISDAGVRSGTACGLYTDTITSNTFDNFVTYASGTGEEYESALNPWSFPYLSGTMAAALAQESADFEGFPQVTGTVSPILAAILAKIYGFPVKPPPIAIDSPEGIAIELVCAEKILSMLKYYSKNLPKPADVLSKFRYLRRICK